MSDDEAPPFGVEREHAEESPTIDFSDVAKPLDSNHALLLQHLIDYPDLTRFKLPWANRCGLPLAVDCEIKGHALLSMQRTFLLETVRQKFGVKGWDYESFGKSEDPEWLRMRDELIEDEDFLQIERAAFFFFLTHFPKMATYAYLITVAMAQVSMLGPMLIEGSSAVFGDNPDEKNKFLRASLKRMLKDFEKEIKEIIGARPVGGSTPRLEADKRAALHLRYDALHKTAKDIKKQYNLLLKQFEASRRRRGYNLEEWQKFWIDTATVMYPNKNERFLSLFARPDKPSASRVAYLQLHKDTGHKISYLPRLVRESRTAAGGVSRRKKRTMKNFE